MTLVLDDRSCEICKETDTHPGHTGKMGKSDISRTGLPECCRCKCSGHEIPIKAARHLTGPGIGVQRHHEEPLHSRGKNGEDGDEKDEQGK